MIENCQWAVSKPDIQILSPRRSLEGRDEGAGFFNYTCCNQYIDWIQGISSILTVFGELSEIDLYTSKKIVNFGGLYIYKHHRRLFFLLGFYIYKHHRRLFLWLGL